MSVINKMLRDLDAGQPSGVVAKPSLFSGLSAIRDTISVGDTDKNERYVHTNRFKPFLLIALMLVAALLALWYLMGFSNVGKPVSFKVLAPIQAPTQIQTRTPAPSPSTTSAANSVTDSASSLAAPEQKAINANPNSQLTTTPEQPGVVAGTKPQAAEPLANPVPTQAPAQAPALAPTAMPAQPMITLPEPVSSMNSLNFARMLAEPPLPRAVSTHSKSAAAAAGAQGSTFPAAASKAEKKALPETALAKPAVAAVPAAAATPVSNLPRVVALNPPRSSPERAPALDTSTQAQKQAAVQETLAQAQNLWNAGSKEAAMELLRDAVAAIERAKASGTLPLDSPALPSLVRELARMELAEGRASQVLDLLIRLEPLVSGQADLWAVRGNAAQRLGQHQQASNAYLAALKLRPNEPRWMLGAAVSLAAQGQMVAAAALTDKARMTGSVSPEVLNYMKQLGVPIR
jgi:MSHA biogenesis protein MshN